MKAAIIGAGIGGLAVALRLKARGFDVTVYEKNDRAGGKMAEIRSGGYRFDTGPSLFTLPELAKELFDLWGEDIDEWLPYESLDNNCRYYFSDGTVFNFYRDRQLLAAEICTQTGQNFESIRRRLDRSREIYELSAPVFLYRPFARRFSDFNTAPYKKIAGKLLRMDFFRTMHQANRADFKDGNIVQLFDRYATYNGSNPYKAPATLNMIAHLENNTGACFPLRGMYSIADSLYTLACKVGVRFRFNSRVSGIITGEGQAAGIVADGGTERFDITVCDADVRYVANHLLENHPLKKRLNRSEPSSSALIFYWGVGRNFPDLDLHNILFSGGYKAEFDCIFGQAAICEDPTVYIFISSKIVKTDAPAGCENWYVMVNAPSAQDQYTGEFIAAVRKNIIGKVNRMLNTDIEKYIEVEKMASPLTIEENTNSVGGALYGVSSNSMFSAFARHPNHLRKIPNLYFVGGSVHPGGGIPLCLASAAIVDNEIRAAYG